MKRINLTRLGGLAAMVCGVLYALERYRTSFDAGPPFALLLIAAMVAIASIATLLQRERYGYEGALASAAAFVGVALILGAFIGFPSFGGDVLGVGLDILLLGVGMLVATIGIIALGIFTLDAGVLPWWGGVALIAGNPLVGVFLLFFVGLDFLYGSWPVVVPWVVVGFAVFRTGTRQSQQPRRVR